jgi:hypothetical protein
MDFIERIFHLAPNNGSGSLELILLELLLVCRSPLHSYPGCAPQLFPSSWARMRMRRSTTQ